MEEDERLNLISVATFDESNEKANEAMGKLRKIDKTYHWCAEWDDLVICSSDIEANHCTCFEE